jgi:hypothetical protein
VKRILLLIVLATALSSQVRDSSLKIEQVMTAQELQQTGVSTLTSQQRDALDRWLVNYTIRVLSLSQSVKPQDPNPPAARTTGFGCASTVESTIDGDFNGWEGETIFKLDNGQIWQQAEYDYMYSYSFRPDVTIYQTRSGCRMKVEDEEETVLVKRIK